VVNVYAYLLLPTALALLGFGAYVALPKKKNQQSGDLKVGSQRRVGYPCSDNRNIIETKQSNFK
jgi:hypothetical protein